MVLEDYGIQCLQYIVNVLSVIQTFVLNYPDYAGLPEFIRKALVAIAMGKIHHPHLAQRVDSIILRMLDMYLRDPEINARYNKAFERGWQSPEWQQMPTLQDLLRFCSKERLNLKSFEELDRLAINQI